MQCITSCHIASHNITSHHITSHCIALHWFVLQLHCIVLHHITSHWIASYLAARCLALPHCTQPNLSQPHPLWIIRGHSTAYMPSVAGERRRSGTLMRSLELLLLDSNLDIFMYHCHRWHMVWFPGWPEYEWDKMVVTDSMQTKLPQTPGPGRKIIANTAAKKVSQMQTVCMACNKAFEMLSYPDVNLGIICLVLATNLSHKY